MTFQDELVARTIAEWVRFGRDEGESAKTVTVWEARPLRRTPRCPSRTGSLTTG